MKRLLLFFALFYFASTNAQINIDSIIQGQMAQKRIAAVSALIVKKGEPVWYKAYGKANVDLDINATTNMSFMLASISKTITATALMQVWENGGFDLDDNINDYLSFDVINPNFTGEAITFRQLLTHTSGIVDDWNTLIDFYVDGDSPIPLNNFCQDYLSANGSYYSSSNFSTNAPGTNYEYSNVGTALAGYLVEAITGIDFNQYCKDSIFTPLCMDNTAWFLSELNESNIASPHYYEDGAYTVVEHYGYPDYPDGQLRTNATSLGRFLNMYMNYGVHNGTRILDSSTVAIMLTEQVPTLEAGQGLIWYSGTQSGKTWWGHNGGDLGVSTDMRFFPSDSIGIVLLTNGDQANYIPILNQLLNFAQSLTPNNNTYPCGQLLDDKEYLFEPDAMLKAYPNPASTQITLETNKLLTDETITIYDITGKTVKLITNVNGSKIKIEISDLSMGMYNIHCNNRHIRFIKE